MTDLGPDPEPLEVHSRDFSLTFLVGEPEFWGTYLSTSANS